VIGMTIILCLAGCSNSSGPSQNAGAASAPLPLAADQQCSSGGSDFGPPPGGFVQSPGILCAVRLRSILSGLLNGAFEIREYKALFGESPSMTLAHPRLSANPDPVGPKGRQRWNCISGKKTSSLEDRINISLLEPSSTSQLVKFAENE
jgi:hypothetical protein